MLHAIGWKPSLASIFEELEKKTLAHPPIEKDSSKRIAKYHKNLISNLQKLSVEIEGVDCSVDIRKQATPIIPEVFTVKVEPLKQTFTSNASYKSNKIPMFIEFVL